MNWQIVDEQNAIENRSADPDKQIRLIRKYAAIGDVNLFKTVSYLGPFMKDRIDPESKGAFFGPRQKGNEDLFWIYDGNFQSTPFYVILSITSAMEADGKPRPYAMIELKLDCEERLNTACGEMLAEQLEVFLRSGYSTHSAFRIPVEITVEDFFCRHDGGNATLYMKYSETETLRFELRNDWYTPCDANHSWGQKQEIMVKYMNRIRVLDCYY